MKKLFASALLLGSLTAFAKDATEPNMHTAFYGYTSHDFSRNNNYQSRNKPVPFFIGYRFIVSDQNDNNLEVLSVRENNVSPSTINNVHINWDWEIGHEAVVGVNFSNTFFSLFANGQYMRHKRTIRNSVVSGTIQPQAPLQGAIGNPDTDVEANSSVSGKTRFWKAGLFLAYTSYKHGTFFLMPYIGPQYYYHRLTVDSTINDVTNAITINPAFLQKCQGVGPLIGTTGKYYFNKVFYAYGDIRLSFPMLRLNERFLEDFNDGQNASQRIITNNFTRVDVVLHEGVGIGFDIRRKKWEIDFMINYEVANFFECGFTYHNLGASIVFGF